METIDQGRRRAAAMLGAGMGGILCGLAAGPVWGAWKPDMNVDFVVPAGPGGALDQTGRAMKQFYDETAGPGAKSFLVTNKPGANGKIAFEVLLQKRGDPHFLSINSHGYISSYLTGNLDILPHRDLTPIAVIQDEFVVAATTPNVIALKKAGKIRVLAVSAGERLGGLFADVPTWKEQGIDSTFSSSMGIVAPKGISEEQVRFWEDLCRRMSRSAMWVQLAETNQSRPNFMGHRDAARFYEEEYQSMREIVARLGLLEAGK